MAPVQLMLLCGLGKPQTEFYTLISSFIENVEIVLSFTLRCLITINELLLFHNIHSIDHNIRGCKEDYDGWKAAGCEGWGWQDVLPHFMSLEVSFTHSIRDFDPSAVIQRR